MLLNLSPFATAARLVPFDPRHLGSTLLGWWSAREPSTLILAGSAVTTWTDQITGLAPTQGTAGSKPTYSATSFNGYPGVTFDGTDDYLSIESCPFPTGATPSEIWALVSQDATNAETAPAGRIPLGYGANVGAQSRSANRLITGSENRARATAGDGTTAASAIDTGVVLLGRHVMRGRFEATQVSVAVDGGALGTPTATTLNTTGTRVRLGSGTSDVVANFWLGQISDIIITGLLSEAQAASMAAFLKARGGIA